MTLETHSSTPINCTFAITYLNRCTVKQKSQTWFTGTQAFKASDIQLQLLHIVSHCENNQYIRNSARFQIYHTGYKYNRTNYKVQIQRF